MDDKLNEQIFQTLNTIKYKSTHIQVKSIDFNRFIYRWIFMHSIDDIMSIFNMVNKNTYTQTLNKTDCKSTHLPKYWCITTPTQKREIFFYPAAVKSTL